MNQKIIEELSKLADKEKLSNNFKYRAYKNAITSLKEYPETITSSSQLSTLKGFGKGILQKIDEIITFGELQNQPTLTPKQELIQTLTNVYGIGDKKALDLIDNHNIQSLQQLKEKQNELLNDKQKIGLKYYNHLLKRIPRQEMDLHKKFIYNIWMDDLNNIPKEFKFEIVGSYRRNAESSGDIDILITFEPHLQLLPQLINILKSNNYIIESLAEGTKKFMGICKLPLLTPRRIDIIWTSPKEYPFGLLYFTGCDKYNRNMREHAHKLKLKLNEKEIISISSPPIHIPPLNTEEEICSFLNLPYIPPHLRNGPLTLSQSL